MDKLTLSIPYYRRRGADLTLAVEQAGSRLRLAFDYHKGMVEEVKCMVGARWDKTRKAWFVDHCDRNLLQLLVLSGNPPSWFARYDETVDVDRVLEAASLIKPIRKEVRPHQRVMLAHCLHKRRVELGSDMGTGKTLAAVELMEHVHARWPEAMILYVGKGNPLEATKLELAKWRCKLAHRPDLLHFVTFSSLYRYLECWEKGKPAPRCVVFDEGQHLKNPGSKQSEAAQHLMAQVRKEHDDDCFGVIMTGTPAPKDYVDWFGQIEVLQPGWFRESNVTQFGRRLKNLEQVDGPYGSYPKFLSWKQDEVDKLVERLKGICVRFDRRDVLDLPPPVYEELNCPPTPEMARAGTMVLNMANSGLDALERLRQLADGISYREGDGKERQVSTAEVPKDAALKDLLERYEDGGRIGIFAAYSASVDKCVRLASEQGWDVLRVDGRGMTTFGTRDKAPRYATPQAALLALQSSGEPSDRLAFIAQAGSGGAGLNLQGLSVLVFYSNSFSGGDRMQAEARPQRPGNQGLTIFDLICLPTDRLVLGNLKNKMDAQALTLGQLKEMM